MMNDDILAPGVMQFDLDEKLAKSIIKKSKKIKDWPQSQVGSGFLKIHIRSSENISMQKYMPELCDQAENEMLKCINIYKKFFEVEIKKDEGLNLLRYENYDKYEYHSDDGPDTKRTLSVIFYLNPSDYIGGETHFKYFDLSVKPKSPKIVLFPSSYAYLHAAKQVTSGIKYVIVTWLS